MAGILVIDKSVFQGASRSELCNWAKEYVLVLCYPLGVECLGDATRGRDDLLDRIQEVIRGGAHCGAQPLKLVDKERASQSPVDSIIDGEVTDLIKAGDLQRGAEPYTREAQEYDRCLQPIVQGMLELGETYYTTIVEKGRLAWVRSGDMCDKDTRLRLWAQVADEMGRRLVETGIPDMASYITPKYYAWQSQRLRWILGLSGPTKTQKVVVHRH